MKVNADIKLEKKGRAITLAIFGMDAKLNELAYHFLGGKEGSIRLEGFFSEPRKYKTDPQLAYLFGVLAPLWKQNLENQGWIVPSKEMAIEALKKPYGFTVDIVNEKTGEVKESVPKSIKTASVKEVRSFIDQLFMGLVQDGVEVMTPEEYKKGKKWL